MQETKLSSQDLQLELDQIDEKIRHAIGAVDEDRIIKLESRKKVLPVMITQTQITELKETISKEESRLEDLCTEEGDALAAYKLTQEAFIKSKAVYEKKQSNHSSAKIISTRQYVRVGKLNSQLRELEAKLESYIQRS